MGSPDTEEGYHFSQGPQHRVSIPNFWMSRYPITQAQWAVVASLPKIAESLDPECANFPGADRPVEQVSWYEAMEFCARLSQLTNKQYDLPREAEWEYACRGNTQTPFHFGETLTTDLANYSGVDWEYQAKICSKGAYGAGPLGCDRRETTPVNYFAVGNIFGLSDLHGNIREWCADPWHRNYTDAPTDGRIWQINGDESKRVIRGGSWNVGPQKCRSARRDRFDPHASLYDIGFRVVYRFGH
jgi:formylglycine-generating enzyme required for sulfatase activity